MHFVRSANRTPTTCEEGKPLTWAAPGVDVWRWEPPPADAREAISQTWSFDAWKMMPHTSGTRYQLRVDRGALSSTQPGGGIY